MKTIKNLTADQIRKSILQLAIQAHWQAHHLDLALQVSLVLPIEESTF